MTAALIILAAMVAVGLPLYLLDRRERKRPQAPAPKEEVPTEEEPAPEVCCGQHEVCEKDSLLTAVSNKVEYYDDEELDRFRGRGPEDYEPEEIEEFRDVLLTLLPDDIAGWGRSLQLRGIELPSAVRDELLLIVSERRQPRPA